MFKAVIKVRQIGDSILTLEGFYKRNTYDEAAKDLDDSKKIWEDDYVSGKVVEC